MPNKTLPVAGPDKPSRTRLSLPVTAPALLLVLIVMVCVAVSIGSVGVRLDTVAMVIRDHLIGAKPAASAVDDRIVWHLRLPRVLLAAVVGAGLAAVGVALQATVRNPLADPYVLGVSAGAGLLASVAITLGSVAVAGLSTSAAAFVGALVATMAVLMLSRRAGRVVPGRLVLAGVTLSYLFSGATSFVIFRSSDPNAAHSVLFWLLGSLSESSWKNLTLPAAAVVVSGVYLILQARTLNALAAGDDAALSLGVSVHRTRIQLLVAASLLTGVLVAVSGGIGFVGLIVPHVVRLVIGPDHRRLLPTAMLVGAIYLVAVDMVCRIAVRPEELPIGIVTAVLGAPVFLWLLRRSEAS
ncbi:ABC transporter permease [Actinosynnema sp. ALI-1.44]|uniref:FecCD family ABC transporter permease n=1 Tax=Actinosynnema sp. ALI-1.44 TaxID=1933779 RepID=UPI00097C9A12|nr:iron ABC transporter permease [Actinosynnema sp. ALI-1.44]ONI78053.1 ABC transporter permease [Actinosynnema sp. ALI-1.44]